LKDCKVDIANWHVYVFVKHVLEDILMATTKLTLTIEPDVVDMAKRYAREHKTSVSATFSRIIRAIAAEGGHEEISIPPRSALAKVAGIIALPRGKTVDDLRAEALMEKYGDAPSPETKP